ncbi:MULTISPECIES: hypothetical protein [Actinomycetes]|uniref:hypothetical protein n=1 Tax=Actinomycetes TaxID=1760 RepID=UPI0018F87FAA|nr:MULTISPECIES: hypothetical protein [Actinomycetes]
MRVIRASTLATWVIRAGIQRTWATWVIRAGIQGIQAPWATWDIWASIQGTRTIWDIWAGIQTTWATWDIWVGIQGARATWSIWVGIQGIRATRDIRMSTPVTRATPVEPGTASSSRPAAASLPCLPVLLGRPGRRIGRGFPGFLVSPVFPAGREGPADQEGSSAGHPAVDEAQPVRCGRRCLLSWPRSLATDTS